MYEGIIINGKPNVTKSGYDFLPDESLQYKKLYHVFTWGNTKGAEQLAFAILMEEYGVDFADNNYRDFSTRVINKLDAGCNFKLSKKEIEYWRKNPK